MEGMNIPQPYLLLLIYYSGKQELLHVQINLSIDIREVVVLVEEVEDMVLYFPKLDEDV